MAIQFPPVDRDRIYATRQGLARGIQIGMWQVQRDDLYFAMRNKRGWKTLPNEARAKGVWFSQLVNQAPMQIKGARTQAVLLGKVAGRIVGVSRDSAGAALGLCTVMVFETQRRLLVYETVSDANGNWSMDAMPGLGPFFYVEYLVGSPDRAGTSLNTNMPSVV